MRDVKELIQMDIYKPVDQGYVGEVGYVTAISRPGYKGRRLIIFYDPWDKRKTITFDSEAQNEFGQILSDVSKRYQRGQNWIHIPHKIGRRVMSKGLTSRKRKIKGSNKNEYKLTKRGKDVLRAISEFEPFVIGTTTEEVLGEIYGGKREFWSQEW